MSFLIAFTVWFSMIWFYELFVWCFKFDKYSKYLFFPLVLFCWPFNHFISSLALSTRPTHLIFIPYHLNFSKRHYLFHHIYFPHNAILITGWDHITSYYSYLKETSRNITAITRLSSFTFLTKGHRWWTMKMIGLQNKNLWHCFYSVGL